MMYVCNYCYKCCSVCYDVWILISFFCRVCWYYILLYFLFLPFHTHTPFFVSMGTGVQSCSFPLVLGPTGYVLRRWCYPESTPVLGVGWSISTPLAYPPSFWLPHAWCSSLRKIFGTTLRVLTLLRRIAFSDEPSLPKQVWCYTLSTAG